LEAEYSVFEEGGLIIYKLALILRKAFGSSLSNIDFKVLYEIFDNFKMALVHGKVQRVPHYAVFDFVEAWV